MLQQKSRLSQGGKICGNIVELITIILKMVAATLTSCNGSKDYPNARI
jgi:hypothetical protein